MALEIEIAKLAYRLDAALAELHPDDNCGRDLAIIEALLAAKATGTLAHSSDPQHRAELAMDVHQAHCDLEQDCVFRKAHQAERDAEGPPDTREWK